MCKIDTEGRLCHLPREARFLSLKFDTIGDVIGESNRFIQINRQEGVKSGMSF